MPKKIENIDSHQALSCLRRKSCIRFHQYELDHLSALMWVKMSQPENLPVDAHINKNQ